MHFRRSRAHKERVGLGNQIQDVTFRTPNIGPNSVQEILNLGCFAFYVSKGLGRLFDFRKNGSQLRYCRRRFKRAAVPPVWWVAAPSAGTR